MLTPSLSLILCLAAPALSFALARRGAGAWRAGLPPLTLIVLAMLAARLGGWFAVSSLSLSSGQVIEISPTARLLALAAVLPLLAILLAARAGRGTALVSLCFLILPALFLMLPLLPYVAGVLPLRFAALPLKIWGALGLLGAALALFALVALTFKALNRKLKTH